MEWISLLRLKRNVFFFSQQSLISFVMVRLPSAVFSAVGQVQNLIYFVAKLTQQQYAVHCGWVHLKVKVSWKVKSMY